MESVAEENILKYLKKLPNEQLIAFLMEYYEDRIHPTFRLLGLDLDQHTEFIVKRDFNNAFGKHIEITLESVSPNVKPLVIITENIRTTNGLYHIKCRNFFAESLEVEPLYHLANRLRKYKIQQL